MSKRINHTDRMREPAVADKFKIDVNRLGVALLRKCQEIANEFHKMSSAERMIFINDEPGFPVDEKRMLLDTCIGVMEQSEDFEICATLHKMRLLLI